MSTSSDRSDCRREPSELEKAQAVIRHDIDQREPLEVEALVSEDARRLAEATSNVLKPLPASCWEECRELIDPPQKRSEREISRVLEILDELERGRD